MNQSQELLVEDDKLLEFDLFMPGRAGGSKQAPYLDRRDQQPLLGEAVANLGDRGCVLDVLGDMSPLVGGVDQIFRHAVSKSLTSGNQPHGRVPELSSGEYQVYERPKS